VLKKISYHYCSNRLCKRRVRLECLDRNNGGLFFLLEDVNFESVLRRWESKHTGISVPHINPDLFDFDLSTFMGNSEKHNVIDQVFIVL